MEILTINIEPKLEVRNGRAFGYDQTPIHFDVFSAYLDGRHLVTSARPLIDSAQMLISEGVDPERLATMKHENRTYPSFAPRSLEFWANLEISIDG